MATYINNLRTFAYFDITAGGAGEADSKIAAHAGDANAHHAATEPMCRAYLSTAQSIPVNSLAVVNLDATDWDIGSNFDTVNHRFVAPKAGYYLVIASVGMYFPETGVNYFLNLTKNGASAVAHWTGGIGADYQHIVLSYIFHLAAGDKISMEVRNGTTGATAAIDLETGADSTYLIVHLLNSD